MLIDLATHSLGDERPVVGVVRTSGDAPMSMIDRLNRLEQLGWIPLADEWLELRRIRNEFAHDYPENPELHLARLRPAMTAGQMLTEILGTIVGRRSQQGLWRG